MSSTVQSLPRVDDKAAVSDHRRPGRRTVAPELVPLLRAPAKEELPEDLRRRFKVEAELPTKVDPVAPARGITLGIALSAPMWLVILGVGYALLR